MFHNHRLPFREIQPRYMLARGQEQEELPFARGQSLGNALVCTICDAATLECYAGQHSCVCAIAHSVGKRRLQENDGLHFSAILTDAPRSRGLCCRTVGTERSRSAYRTHFVGQTAPTARDCVRSGTGIRRASAETSRLFNRLDQARPGQSTSSCEFQSSGCRDATDGGKHLARALYFTLPRDMWC